MSDPLWPVMKPRNGDEDAVREMNAKMILYHPALEPTRRKHNHLMHECHEIVQRNFSVAELFRRTLNQK